MMKKIPVCIMAAALAFGGAAFAQDHGKDSRKHDSTASTSTAQKADKDTSDKGDGLLAKTERGLHRMGTKLRSAFHRDEHADTKTLGGPGSDNDGRDNRMKDAYGNWKAKHEK